jgi:hypothetical protein
MPRLRRSRGAPEEAAPGSSAYIYIDENGKDGNMQQQQQQQQSCWWQWQCLRKQRAHFVRFGHGGFSQRP